MRNFIHFIFSFLLIATLCLFVNQDVRAQWELLIGEEESSWNYVDMDVTLDGGLILITYVDGQYRLLRINVLGQVVMNRSFMELELPAEGIAIRQIKALKDGNYLLRYQVNNEAEYKLAKLTPYGKTIWTTDLEFNQELVEMESGDYWQVFASDLEETLEDRQVILKAFSGEDGSELWTKMYGSEQDETIMKYKQTEDGGYIIAGRQDYFNFFAMYFSPQGNLIKEFNKNFQQGSGYGLEDVTITADNGITLMLMYYEQVSGPESDRVYLWVEKMDEEGDSEWTVQYDYTGPYPQHCSYYFYDIEQTSNGNYFIRGGFSCEFEGTPRYLWLSSVGEIIEERTSGFDGYYSSENSSCFDCSCGSRIDKIQSVSSDGYIISGYDEYDQPMFGDCSELPFIAYQGLSGSTKYYDLDNAENLWFSYGESLVNAHQGYYIAATVNDIQEYNKVYIINTDNGGKSYSNHVSGKLFLDSNENCEEEEAEKGWSNSAVVSIATPEFTRYAFANQNGEFSAQLPTGNYTISYQLDNELVEMGCGESQYTANFTESYDTVSNVNFALNALVDCPKLEVEIGTPLLRRCFKNTYKISYCNKGTIAAEDAKITLEFPDEMIPLESSIEPALKEGQQWTFDLGQVEIGECGFFTVIDSVSCEAELGSTICLKSRILPDDPCEAPNPLWDGSHIEVKGDCSEEYIAFALENTGNGNMEEERNLYVFENDVLVKTEKLQLASGEKRPFYWNVENKTVRLEVEQSPNSPHFNDPAQSIVEACGEGNFSIGYVNSVEQNDRNPSVDIDCQTVIGSFDPNDIQVYPKGISDQYFIEENTKLTYKIRFQNTGNDTAFRVMIVDTLPQGLEGASLNLGNSSHDYTFDIKFGNLLVWTFDNILLPDSTTNEPESHGFVQFSILPKADIELGAKIENKADIYFDFNEAVETNQVFNTISDDLNSGLGSPLSVDLMDMEISLIEGNQVQLDWWTLAETNSSHFEVERSRDGFYFEGIERVKAQGNNEGLQHYQILDSNTEGETLLYYRLKMVDIDGSFEYSKVVSIRFEGQKVRYQLMDFNGRQRLLSWIGDVEEHYTIQVFNTLGQNTLKLKVNDLQSKLPVLDSGVYILQIFDEKGRKVKSKKVFAW